ncbi:CBS domain-containing protein [candidate division KSB1 bacterium]|nr:CBS domain-containing protein [candidate division KSB1 bacterium]
MQTVAHILDVKESSAIYFVSPDDTVYTAIEMMAQKSIGALVVLERGKLVGILSERDYARKVILKNRSSKATPVREIMTSKVITIHPEQRIEDCMAIMTEKKIRHLPVKSEGELVGIISIGDVIRSIISEHEYTIQQLESYISWG